MQKSHFSSLFFVLSIIFSLATLSSKAENLTLESFSFLKNNNPLLENDITAVIEDNNINIQFDELVDMTRLIASFDCNADSLFVNDSLLVSGTTTFNFLKKESLELISKDGSNKSYNLSVKNFDTGFPIVYINTENRAEIVSKEEYLDAELTIDGHEDYSDLQTTIVEIKGRGNSTWTWNKKPYAIKMYKDTKSEILDMPKHRKWVLLANYIDRTLIRNSVAFKIGESVQLDWTSRSRHVDVILNGKHNGNYVLCEKIEIDENRVNISEIKDNEDGNITGGYLLELDSYYDEVNKFKSDIKHLPVNIKDPDEDDLLSDHFNYIKDYFNNIEADLANGSYQDAYENMDINSFIDYWFVYELARNTELWAPKSTYMHKGKDGKLKAGPIWDFDWGTFSSETCSFTSKTHVLYEYLFNDEYFNEQVKKRWIEHRERLADVVEYIDSFKEKLAISEELNFELWPMTTDKNKDEELSHTEAIDKLKASYQAKYEFMDNELYDEKYITSKENIEDKSFNVYGGLGLMHIEGNSIADVSICNISGIIVKQLSVNEGLNTITIDRGIYIVTINNEAYKVVVR